MQYIGGITCGSEKRMTGVGGQAATYHFMDRHYQVMTSLMAGHAMAMGGTELVHSEESRRT